MGIPDIRTKFTSLINHRYVGDPSTVPARKYCCADYFLDYPASIGYVHITSTDVDAPPDFDPKFLSWYVFPRAIELVIALQSSNIFTAQRTSHY